jgi:hypothetical protein
LGCHWEREKVASEIRRQNPGLDFATDRLPQGCLKEAQQVLPESRWRTKFPYSVVQKVKAAIAGSNGQEMITPRRKLGPDVDSVPRTDDGRPGLLVDQMADQIEISLRELCVEALKMAAERFSKPA